MDTNRVDELIGWFRTHDGEALCGMDRDRYFVAPLMEAFGEDIGEILAYLDGMETEDLREVSGIFEEIYGKFMTDEVYSALGALENKIA